MPRNFPSWLEAYVEYTSYTEAPTRMHFFCGVAALAGALRRKTWLPMGHFRWYPNQYVILVAPPGVVAKSTTASLAMDMLRKVPGVKFGPEVVTMAALVKGFAEAKEAFEYQGEFIDQCALSLEAGEFGNLLDPEDREMVDMLVTLWDCRTGSLSKATKNNGSDVIENPFLNLVACTTPAWIAGNFPEYVIGGGFTSRCLFVYAETKRQLVAYPNLIAPKEGMPEFRQALIEDLVHIGTKLVGKFELTKDAYVYGDKWYKTHNESPPALLTDSRLAHYLARKFCHLHKLGMAISAAQRDDLMITEEDLFIADKMLTSLEEDMPKVFAKIGRSEVSNHAERFVEHVRKHGPLSYQDAYSYVHAHFPDHRAFEGVLAGTVRAGILEMIQTPAGHIIKVRPSGPPPSPPQLPQPAPPLPSHPPP